MLRLFFILYFQIIVLQLFAQNDSLEKKVFYYGNGKISSEGYFKDNQPEAYWKTYYLNGNLKSEGNRVNHKLDGPWIFYKENKDTVEIINYRLGIKNGWDISYDSNKVVSKELYLNGIKQSFSYYYNLKKGFYTMVYYKDNLRHGMAYRYKDTLVIALIEYKNGYKISTKKINRFKDTLKQGNWIYFYSKTRKIWKECFYKNDTLDGEYREYNKKGKLIKTLYYINGQLDTAKRIVVKTQLKQEFYANGNLKSKGYYKDSLPVGMHEQYSADGTISKAILYNKEGIKIGEGALDKKGKKTGKWILFDTEGNKKAEGFYKKGFRTKKWIFYYSNKKIEQIGFYRKGRITKTWTHYTLQGNIDKIENYNKKGILDGEYIQYKKDTVLFIKGLYTDGQKDKTWEYHYDYVDIIMHYEEGVKIGKWITTYKNGKLAAEENYEDGVLNGEKTTYYENGILKSYQYYIYGSKEKTWRYYDEDGLEEISITYKNDKEIKVNGIKFKAIEIE